MGGQEKAKLLCSFGGEIIREQGKSFYLGGKTRLVTIQRSSSFRSLLSKMSKLCDADPNSVELKYQLPDVSFDSRMISIENDDDVSNMMDDFDIDRKIPIFLVTNNRGRSSGEEEEEDEEEIADEDDVLDSVGMDGLSFEAVVAARESIRSKSSSGRDSVRYPSVGSSVSGEVFHKDSQSLVVGQEYEDVQSFRNALTSAAIAANFELHMIRSDQRRVTARCAAEGCTWRVHASKLPQVNTFRIRTLTPDHTCIRSEYAGHRQATAKWIANCIREKLRQNRNYRPREIVNDIHRDYGVLITYKRAFLGREKALEELRFEPVLDVEPIEKNVYEPIMGNMDALTWGEIHDLPRKKRAFCEPCQSKEVRPLHCTRCNQTGHNRRTCDVPELVQGEGVGSV